jgi:endonuclease I
MKPIRIIWIFLLAISAFTLVGCDNTPETFEITLSANIEEANPTLGLVAISKESKSYLLTTDEVEGYNFEYWHILGSDTELSQELSFNYSPTSDVSIEAYYTEIIVVENFTVTVFSNVESISVGVEEFLTNSGATQYELTAPEREGFTFVHWKDVDTEEILSLDAVYSFVPTKNQQVIAIYELIVLPEPTLYYETEFEDASKDAYALGTVTLSNQDWIFNDALIGNLATDLSVSGKSVRIRDGYIQSDFTVEDIAQIIFYAGTYGSDSAATVLFQLSTNAVSWVTVDSFTSESSMEEYSYIFDETLFTSLSLDSSAAYYIRIVSESTSRTNIDNLQIYTGEGYVADDTSLYSITFDETMVYQYLKGETADLSGCVATHPIIGATTCNVIGTVDTTIPGVYEITFYKTDEYNNTASITVNITVIDTGNDYLSMDLIPYYDLAEGLYGDDLIDALNSIINTGFVGVTYGEARYILDETDQDPNNSNNLILVYLGTSVSGSWDSGITWNREHVWPQSLLGESADNGTVNMASDLYNLMPSDPGENSSRGNSPYSELGLGYEPRDEVKGDIARALFYMMVMYDELELVNTSPGVHEMGYLDELLAWHYADPVDEFEQARLEVIFGEQHNRNPFVDYPHFVELIWHYTDTPS